MLLNSAKRTIVKQTLFNQPISYVEIIDNVFLGITVFNFAPANKDLGTEFNEYVDVLVVNEVEVRSKIIV